MAGNVASAHAAKSNENPITGLASARQPLIVKPPASVFGQFRSAVMWSFDLFVQCRRFAIILTMPGGHMALIRAIAFPPDGGQLVSAPDDKAIRIWYPATGRTVGIFRGESAPGNPGKTFHVCISDF